MDSAHHDLTDLEAAKPLNDKSPHERSGPICCKCHSLSAPESKLRYCGRCKANSYCSQECARADWAEHKLACESFRRFREGGLAVHEARGGAQGELNNENGKVVDWFTQVPRWSVQRNYVRGVEAPRGQSHHACIY
jgi:hypothetical protein